MKLVEFAGDFGWHHHVAQDELFLVLKGQLDLQFRDRIVHGEQGQFIVVPRGVEHCPRAEAEVEVLLFEPADTLDTGSNPVELTVAEPERP